MEKEDYTKATQLDRWVLGTGIVAIASVVIAYIFS